jgi:peptide-methionine (S)-S-oxide reductase
MDGSATSDADDPPDCRALFGRIPQGWSRRKYGGRHYGVTRTVTADGRIEKIFAEELGGTDIVSANLYLGDRFRPCEMPAAKVLAFLRSSIAVPAGRGEPIAPQGRAGGLAP